VAEADVCLAGIAFPQVNSLGCRKTLMGSPIWRTALAARAIVVTDPMLLATAGSSSRTFGVGRGQYPRGEAQHLAIPPHYGGPG